MNDQPTQVSVVIVDDHQIFRTGLRSSLGDGVHVVGEAATVDDAIAIINQTRPDVVLLDVHLPGGSGGGGGEVAARVLGNDANRATRFLALSVSDAADDVVRVIRAGARGYLTKATSSEEVTEAIMRVHAGDAVFSPRLAGFVLDAFGVGGGEVATQDDELDRLSAREQEVMRMIARGYTYKEVAGELFLSIKTVETHVSNVLRKLQLSNRHELTAWALSKRLL
ncbi:MAG TPA: response regulator transcription factor [Beutenbergiaceae bacterium]|nr:response regulator transcription factor [Beutenbergiaceae bacterium]